MTNDLDDIRPQLRKRLDRAEAEAADLRRQLERENERLDGIKPRMVVGVRVNKNLGHVRHRERPAAAKKSETARPMIESILGQGPKSKNEIQAELERRGYHVAAGKSVRRAVHATLVSMKNTGIALQQGEVWRLK